mgnify:CR=1 FL=1
MSLNNDIIKIHRTNDSNWGEDTAKDKLLKFFAKSKVSEKEAKRKMYYKYATEVANAIAELTGKGKKELEEKLHAIVLKHLRLEEKKEKEEAEKLESLSEEDIEKEYAKRKEKETAKAKGKKKGFAENENGE